MITLEEKGDLLKAHVIGEFTLADYEEFETAVIGELKSAPTLRLLLNLSEMTGFTLDMAWEDIKFTRAHQHDFRRIAVVATDQWTVWIGWLNVAFTDADILVFDTLAEAEDWIEAQ